MVVLQDFEMAFLHFSRTFWVTFILLVIAIVIFDLQQTKVDADAKNLKIKIPLLLLFISITLALLLYNQDKSYAIDFISAYFVELSLSIDNLFVFILIFKYFQIPIVQQHRILFWGIISAIFMRLVMITIGIHMIQAFHWAVYLFGAILMYSAFKIIGLDNHTEVDLENNLIIRGLRKIIKIDSSANINTFFVRDKRGNFAVTKLLVALIFIEKADLIFAVDSIPAVIAITSEPFIVFSSNILAILGLRSMYTMLSYIIERLEHLKYGVAVVLFFLGVKMILGVRGISIPNYISLAFIAICFTIPTIWSYSINKKKI
ncbi:tellurite resistance protein TerC [Alphaproteobacteria bacterium]